MTNSQRIRDSAVMISSTIPSTKYSCSASPLILANGSTAIDGLSGRARAPELTPPAPPPPPPAPPAPLASRPPHAMAGGGGPGCFWGVVGEGRAHPVDAHWPGDVLEALLADVGELGFDFAAHLAERVFRDADAAGLGDAFEPCRDVDAVTEDVIPLDQNIA